jgi:hypothetical protein
VQREEQQKVAATTPPRHGNESVRQTLAGQRDDNDAALQKNDAMQESKQESEFEIRRPSHGGALPK